MQTAAVERSQQQIPATAERQGLVVWAAGKFGVDAGKVFPILKQTCFKGEVDKQTGVIKEASDAEVAALMIVAREHGLNPFLKEIFAFPDKKGGIVPVVGVDGWIRIVNSHPQYDGIEFVYEKDQGSPAWIECHIFRKDRSHPIKVREFMAECRRDTGPWKSHPTRMLRHKAFIQCARVAFGFAGIYDEDEAERIVEATVVADTGAHAGHQQRGAAALKSALAGDGLDVTPKPEATAAVATPRSAEPAKVPEKGNLATMEKYFAKFKECKDSEILSIVRDEVNLLSWTPEDLAEIDKQYRARMAELEGD